MKYLLIIFLCGFIILFSINIQGQSYLPKYPYEPLSFVDLEPIWYHTHIDSTTLGSDSTDGYNYLNIPTHNLEIFDENYIYTVLNGRPIKTELGRTYLYKRDLFTGKLIWSTVFGLGIENGNLEAGRLLSINDNGQLEIISLITDIPYNAGTTAHIDDSFNLLMAKRVFDKETGELLEYQEPDFTDSLLVRSNYSLSTKLEEIYMIGDSMQMLRRLNNINRTWIEVSTRKYNSRSSEIFIDTIVNSNSYWGAVKYGPSNPVQLHDNSYLFFGNSGPNIIMYEMDKRGQIVDATIGDSIGIKANTGRLLKVSDDKSKFLITVSVDRPNTFEEYRDLFVVNRKGKILYSAEIPWGYNTNSILEWNEETNTIVILGTKWYLDERYGALDVLYYDENGNMRIAQSHRLKNEPTYLRTPSVSFIKKVSEDYILLTLFEGLVVIRQDGYLNIDFNAQAVSQMLVDASYFSVASVAAEDVQKDDLLKVYPNPAQNTLTLEMQNLDSGVIQIYDMIGSLVLSQEVQSIATKVDVDIRDLRSGMHVVRYIDHDKNVPFSTHFIKI